MKDLYNCHLVFIAYVVRSLRVGIFILNKAWEINVGEICFY